MEHECPNPDTKLKLKTWEHHAPTQNKARRRESARLEHTRSRVLTWKQDMTGVSGLCHKTMNNTRPKWQNPDTTPPQKGRHLAYLTRNTKNKTGTWQHKNMTNMTTQDRHNRTAQKIIKRTREGREGWARKAQAVQESRQGARAEPEGRTREAPAEQEPWMLARVGLEGQPRRALVRQEARAEPAAWQAARVAPAGQEAWVVPAEQGAWAALAGQGAWAWAEPAGQWAWAEPAGQGAWVAPAGQGAWEVMERPPGQQWAPGWPSRPWGTEEAFFRLLLCFWERDAVASLASTGGAAASSASIRGTAASSAASGGAAASTAASGRAAAATSNSWQAWLGLAWLGLAWLGKTRQGKARQGRAGQGRAGQGRAQNKNTSTWPAKQITSHVQNRTRTHS